MSAFNDGIPQFQQERDGREFALPDNRMFSFREHRMDYFLFQKFHSNEEIANADNSSGAPEKFIREAQHFSGMVAKWPNQMMNSHGAVEERNLLGEEEKRLELVRLMLATGELIGNREYDQASLLVSRCKKLSSQLGNPTERLAYYVSDALHQRIQRMSNNASQPDLNFAFDVDSHYDRKCFLSLAAYYISVLPHIRLMQFTSVQAILDALGNEKIIHVIDLGMRTGSQWTVLMEYLAHKAAGYTNYSRQVLKITAVWKNGEALRNTGKRLQELAKSLRIPFFYNMLEIRNMEEIKGGLLTVKPNEAVAVYAPLILESLLYDPVLLMNVLCVIKKLSPRIMVTVEVEGKHNSPSFVNRLSEVIYNYSACFDLLDVATADRNDNMRVRNEELTEGSRITNIIVCEGKERRVRHVTTDVWRVFFNEAGFTEKNFSFQALYQARLLLKEYASGKYYTLEPDGHAIIVKWKGTPLISLSAWSVAKRMLVEGK